jgi:hypothetical protein
VGVSSAQVSVGGPYVINEGDALTLRASAVGTPSAVQWDLNGDSLVDATTSGLELTRTWAQLQALSATPIDDNGSFALRVSVRYASGDVVLSAPGTTAGAEHCAERQRGEWRRRFSRARTRRCASARRPTRPPPTARRASPTASCSTRLFGHYEDSVTSTASEVELLIPAAYIRDNGSYVARARITDQDGGTSEQTVSVVVQEVAPDPASCRATTMPSKAPTTGST